MFCVQVTSSSLLILHIVQYNMLFSAAIVGSGFGIVCYPAHACSGV